ncbi:D-alanyl-D-alanine carboxypeptidase family protein [Aneurinibacillus sp. UBA3580]|jgi:D-alanyl-D-alanine carboxypeptidase (penicillin-binding protein 5/6)|uniref:D-alanyl-D-alanine carboxypeptidase family protein n=1 Tax=Aneurinibacillus sp. UBA3580 TaxID=1946041 RepID=UPI00257E2B4A|nr:D-alanyl-D-alanine carboxypeptidase family protein [Aneurinibacillus sp. UBA3580]
MSASKAGAPPVLTAKAACLIETEDGRVLWQKNAEQALAPASMTKMMTALLIIEKSMRGEIALTERVRISRRAAAVRGSNMQLRAGGMVTVQALLTGLLIASGNDAAIALAEYASGSVPAFVNEMNERAARLALANTRFRNPHGLSVPGHYASAYDMCVIGRELTRYQYILRITSRRRASIKRHGKPVVLLRNTNSLLGIHAGVDGLKTGYTPQAKYCLCATKPHPRFGRLIAVVMGLPTKRKRNREASALLSYANAVDVNR